MKYVKEYICDNKTPEDKEIIECINIANKEKCIVKLKWFFPYNGWHEMYINQDMSFNDCKSKLPKAYGV